ncbi:MAG: O-antigen ligase family protein [bacterium]|nr:O-antigen ligase family protein [bacterium]
MNFFRKLENWLLTLYVFLLPWQTRLIINGGELNGGAWEYGTMSLYTTEIILLLLILMRLVTILAGPKTPLPKVSKGLIWAGGATAIISALSFVWAMNQGLALYTALKLLEAVLLAWLVMTSSVHIRTITQVFVGGAVVQAGIGLWQFFTQQAPAQKWLGWAAHEASQLGTFVIEADGERWLRAYGGLPHPNMLGGLLAVALLLLFALYWDAYRRMYHWFVALPDTARRQTWKEERSQIFRFGFELSVYLIAAAILTLGLIVTFSRGAWLALVGAAVLTVLIIIWKRDAKKLLAWLKLAIVMMVMAVLALQLWPGLVESRFDPSDRLGGISADKRGLYQEDAIQLLRDNWLDGVGMGNSTLAVHDSIDNHREAFDYQPVHNVFLLIPVEISVFGLIAFGFLLYELVRLGWIHLKGPLTVNRFTLAGFGAIISLIIIAVFDHYLWSLYFGQLLFWFGIGFFGRSLKESDNI